jgi:hypothetical protein
LLTAQKLADDIKESANQEAARVMREAEGRADLLLQKSQARLEDVQREIDGLRMKRRDVETSLEGIIGTISNTIAYVREQDAAHREEKILMHRPRHEAAPAPGAPNPAHASPAPNSANQSPTQNPSHLAHLAQPAASQG